MKIQLSLAFLILSFAMVHMSYNDGPANRVGSGYTGAPGEEGTVCADCHLFGAFSEPQTELTLTDLFTGEVSESYQPGREYIVSLRVNSFKLGNGSNPRYGMQMTALDEGNMDIGQWSMPSTNAQISYAQVSNTTQLRAYLEHKLPSFTKTFTARWRAPLCSSDTITFYHIGNAVNFDQSQSGDKGGQGDSTKFYVEIENTLTFYNTDTLAGTYYATDSIRSSSIVTDSSEVYMYASEISLLDSFQVQNESILEVSIDTCQ